MKKFSFGIKNTLHYPYKVQEVLAYNGFAYNGFAYNGFFEDFIPCL